MIETYNIYCDESCHLEHDGLKVMAIGAIWCPVQKTKEIANRLREIKTRHSLPTNFEIKWSKVSPSKAYFYKDILDYFFDDDDLHFRVLVVPDKSKLQHDLFNQSHDDFYYKMYFDMLKVIFNPKNKYRVYVDIKDSKGGKKVEKLHSYLCHNMYDFSRNILERIQIVKSHNTEPLQLADLLIGAITYRNRDLKTSETKLELIERIIQRTGYSLTKSTLPQEKKFNVFIWRGVVS